MAFTNDLRQLHIALHVVVAVSTSSPSIYAIRHNPPIRWFLPVHLRAFIVYVIIILFFSSNIKEQLSYLVTCYSCRKLQEILISFRKHSNGNIVCFILSFRVQCGQVVIGNIFIRSCIGFPLHYIHTTMLSEWQRNVVSCSSKFQPAA